MSRFFRPLICLYVLATSFSTLAAVIEIETILVTGVICSFTGIVAGISALMKSETREVIAAWSIPAMALLLFFLESQLLHLGPKKAAMPFSILFILNQAIANYILLRCVTKHARTAGSGLPSFGIQSILFMTAVMALGLAFVQAFFPAANSLMVFLALVIVGITIICLLTVGTRIDRSASSLTEDEFRCE